jgi:pyruvate kinase
MFPPAPPTNEAPVNSSHFLPQSGLHSLISQLARLRQDALDLEGVRAAELDRMPPACQPSARNLLHYLAVRRHDLRPLQRGLGRLGLSSLGRLEAHVLPTLDAVLSALHHLAGTPAPDDLNAGQDMEDADRLLREHADALLGPSPAQRRVRIMVTMPGAAAHDPEVTLEALRRGMDLLRINCAHDTPKEWALMVAHARSAAQRLGRPCRISADLGGPKLRTGPVKPLPAVFKWKPLRDSLGRVVTPAQILLVPEGAGLSGLPLAGPGFGEAQPGDKIRLSDARGRRRTLKVVQTGPDGCLCTSRRTGYVVPGTSLRLERAGHPVAESRVGALSARPGWVPLRIGDRLLITSDSLPGEAAGADGQPAHIGCTLPEVFAAVQVGHRVLLDDGKLSGIVQWVSPEQFELQITQASGGEVRLRAQKGINLPDTDLELPVLSEEDHQHLRAVAADADLVALSFVRRPADIGVLVRALNALGSSAGIILKIENKQAFDQLPELLLAAMQHAPVAVMVARGDLAAEVGFERLAEVQEEILWVCEAAHTPVIWATQVLDTLARTGVPTRAEVTDAAMSGRAEAVMLNKGPFILEAITFLGGVLTRMQAHQQKKTAMLRSLEVSRAARQ